ncbi:phosphatase PAP2 family protein [Pedococcus sp. 2YAF34]|uniref:phosphatase PAP2 family protein n=1 Tax=Pedococcus sp. 2YAF34 TaxID=3233032 RepID=UPI003F9DDD70
MSDPTTNTRPSHASGPNMPASNASRIPEGGVDRQLAMRATAAGVAVVAGMLVVLPLLLTVESKWTPLLELDNSARDDLHSYGLAHPSVTSFMTAVSAVSGALGWQVVSVALIAWLLARRRIRAAAFVLVANAGSSLLNTLLKAMVNRHRPVVAHPFVHLPGQSFPSGHAQAAATGFTVALFVLWPWLRSSGMRRASVVVAVVATLVIGYSRVALAAHFVSDVVAGYFVGVMWTVVLAAAFHVWRPVIAGAQGRASMTTRFAPKRKHTHDST